MQPQGNSVETATHPLMAGQRRTWTCRATTSARWPTWAHAGSSRGWTSATTACPAWRARSRCAAACGAWCCGCAAQRAVVYTVTETLIQTLTPTPKSSSGLRRLVLRVRCAARCCAACARLARLGCLPPSKCLCAQSPAGKQQRAPGTGGTQHSMTLKLAMGQDHYRPTLAGWAHPYTRHVSFASPVSCLLVIQAHLLCYGLQWQHYKL